MANLPVIQFIQERLAESDKSLDTRPGGAFYDLFVKPQELMLQPLLTAMETALTAQSIARMRALADPNSFDENLVDGAASNVYVDRFTGDYARTSVRVYYDSPVDREFPSFSAEFTAGGLSFFNESDLVITALQMAIQQEGDLFYMDVPVRAQNQGDQYNVDPGAITQFVNDPSAITVTNRDKAQNGLPRETNIELLDRAKNSIGVRDLETVKGINAILREKFPSLRGIQAIGMGDPEMMRDILYNAHIGGKTDIYVKTPALVEQSKNILGITFDSTRELAKNTHMELTAKSFDDPTSNLNTPYIVSTSVRVKDDVIETAACVTSVPIAAPGWCDLSSGEWIRLSIDGAAPVNIKVSGAIPRFTQRFEVINAINATVGVAVASAGTLDRIILQSQTVGANSSIEFSTPASGAVMLSDATATLFPGLAGTAIRGEGATVYLENIDYRVDYERGMLIKIDRYSVGQAAGILSGVTLISDFGVPIAPPNRTDLSWFTAAHVSFAAVRVGDTFNVTSASDPSLIGHYVVQEVIDDKTIRVAGFVPSLNSMIGFNIVSNQTVVVDYRYNPLSIDVGGQVLLSDGVTRGIRSGRDNYTITGMAFIDIQSIEEIDPDTGEGLGTFLTMPGGFGAGGFGEGGFGTASGGDYLLVVNDPVSRFSALEDAVLVLDPSLYGKSFRVSYYAAPEIVTLHGVCRDDLERVVGADVLPKNFVPGFVDISIGIRRDPTNASTPSDAELSKLIGTLVESTDSGQGLKASDIVKLLEDQGVDSVQTPFTMTARVINPDGSTTFYSSQDILSVDTVILPKKTDNFVTPRIVHFYTGNVSVVGVA